MFGLFNENVSPYISVSELIEGNNVNRNVQVFGDVLVESIDFDTQSGILTFDITDGESTAKSCKRVRSSSFRRILWWDIQS
jgi:uncharacterized protein (DUF934 family)